MRIARTRFPVLAGVRGLLSLPLLFPAALPASAGSAPSNDLPYRLERRQELVLAGAGVAVAGAALALGLAQDTLDPESLAGLDRDDVNGFDRSATENWSPGAATTSDLLMVASVLSPGLLVVGGQGRRNAGTVLAMYGETLLLVNGIVHVLKGATGRKRPFVYNDDPEIPASIRLERDAVRSYPSGHAANAFAAAVFLGTVHSRLHPRAPSRKWIWAGGLAAASAVAYLRFAAGVHFPSDALTGAALGAVAGYLVPEVHESETVRLGLAPSARGFAVSVRF